MWENCIWVVKSAVTLNTHPSTMHAGVDDKDDDDDDDDAEAENDYKSLKIQQRNGKHVGTYTWGDEKDLAGKQMQFMECFLFISPTSDSIRHDIHVENY